MNFRLKLELRDSCVIKFKRAAEEKFINLRKKTAAFTRRMPVALPCDSMGRKAATLRYDETPHIMRAIRLG